MSWSDFRPITKLYLLGGFFLLSWFIGTILIHRFEQGYPIGESYFNALYFTIITTATIGFGDLVPHTVAGKIVTMGYAIIYVPLFLYSMTLVFQTKYHQIHKSEKLFEKAMHDTEADVESIIAHEHRKNKV